MAALSLPPFVFFHDRGTTFLSSLTLKTTFQLFFPLLGLYAFTLVTAQVLITTNLRWLKQLWPGIIKYHRAQGLFVLLFATLHPLFILAGYGIVEDLHFRYIAPNLRWWTLPAYTALTILYLTVITAWLAWRGRNISWWRQVHRLNYLVFALVWIHSWFIGTDTKTTLLRSVWLIYLGLVSLSAFGRYYPKLKVLFTKPRLPGTA